MQIPEIIKQPFVDKGWFYENVYVNHESSLDVGGITK